MLTRGDVNAICEGKYNAQNEFDDGYGVGDLSLLHGLKGLHELTSSKNLGKKLQGAYGVVAGSMAFLRKYCQECNSLRIPKV